MIVIVDYGMGNLGSIANMLKKIGAEAIITSDGEKIRCARKLILPGVGSFDHGIRNIREYGLDAILENEVLVKKTPIMGICLGMQLMTKKSEEGSLQGLGWVDAEAIKFNFDRDSKSLKIPHMGWNTVKINKKSLLFEDNTKNQFYFVHSFYTMCRNPGDVLTETLYGYEFVSSFLKENIIGVQFHPEKSHKYGINLLKNFVEKFEYVTN